MHLALPLLPNKSQIEEFFGRLRAMLIGLFEALVLILAMISIFIVAWQHAAAMLGPTPDHAKPEVTPADRSDQEGHREREPSAIHAAIGGAVYGKPDSVADSAVDGDGRTTNTAVKWLVTPALGAVSSAGLYTAPATLNSRGMFLKRHATDDCGEPGERYHRGNEFSIAHGFRLLSAYDRSVTTLLWPSEY